MSALNRTVDVHRTALTTSVITRVHVLAATQMCMTTAHSVQVMSTFELRNSLKLPYDGLDNSIEV